MPDPSDKYGAFGTIRDLKDDRELAAAFGDMIVAWADAERLLSDIMHKITTLNYALSMDILSRIGTFESRIKLIHMLLDRWAEPGGTRKAAIKGAEGLSRLSRTRNGYVHAAYVSPLDRSMTVAFDIREPPGPTRRRVIRASDVQQHIKAVHTRMDQLHKIVSALRPKSQK